MRINSETVSMLMVVVHVAFMAFNILYMLFARKRLNRAHLLWMGMIPFFGPIAGFVLCLFSTPEVDMSWMEESSEAHSNALVALAGESEVVPLEEALLINNPVKRRTLILRALRLNPVKYLDLLLIARHNEDTETAHYAVSTVVEIQRQMQVELQEIQKKIEQAPDNLKLKKSYARLMVIYCNSNLIAGPLLNQQRQRLRGLLEEIVSKDSSRLYYDLLVHTLMSLGEQELAKKTTQEMLNQWPLQEESWLTAMEVVVNAHDQYSLQGLLDRMEETPVDWTLKGRSLMTPFMDTEVAK